MMARVATAVGQLRFKVILIVVALHGAFTNGWNQSVLSGLISGCAGSTTPVAT